MTKTNKIAQIRLEHSFYNEVSIIRNPSYKNLFVAEIDKKVGTFEKGYAFDALVIGGRTDKFIKVSPSEVVERFCYAGETGNIRARFLSGVRIDLK